MKNDNSNMLLKRGRPPKKDYDPDALMRELIDTTAEIYREKGEIKATALELSLPPGKVKKLLITGNVLSYPETEQIQELLRQGKTMVEIQHMMGLSYSTLHTYLPYSKVIYKMSEISQNAERVFWRAFFSIFVVMIPYNQRCIFMRFYRISIHYRKFKDAFAPLSRLKSLILR